MFAPGSQSIDSSQIVRHTPVQEIQIVVLPILHIALVLISMSLMAMLRRKEVLRWNAVHVMIAVLVPIVGPIVVIIGMIYRKYQSAQR